MALLVSNPDGSFASMCVICDRQLTEPIFATTHFISDDVDPLWRYSDAAMHWGCYASWEHQRQFASKYFDAMLEWKPKNPYWAVICQSEDLLVTANPELPEPEVVIDLRATGSGFCVLITEWTTWVNGGWRGSCVHELERDAMLAVENFLRRAVPDSEALLTIAKQNMRPTDRIN